MNDKNKQIQISYTNHKGKTTDRIIIPEEIWFGETEWHQGQQWFLRAYDVRKEAMREFAMLQVLSVSKLVARSNGQQDNNKLKEAKLFTDGGSRGNPGPSAIGYVVLSMDDEELHKDSKYLGITTNNQAEYQGLREGLEQCRTMNIPVIHVYMDSLLVVNQMKGIFKVKNRDLWPVHDAVRELVKQFSNVTFTHVPRNMNKIADGMVNECLDSQVQ